MKEIKYSNHLKLRISIRKFPPNYPKKVYKNPEQNFFDNVEGTNIAIKRLKYNEKVRNIMIAYEESDKEVEIITIHPISDVKILNRIMSRRWTKNE